MWKILDQMRNVIHLQADMDSWFARLPYEEKMAIYEKYMRYKSDSELARRYQ